MKFSPKDEAGIELSRPDNLTMEIARILFDEIEGVSFNVCRSAAARVVARVHRKKVDYAEV